MVFPAPPARLNTAPGRQPIRWPLALAAALLLAACSGTEPYENSSSHRHAYAPRPGAAQEYVVQRGDTLYSIAFRNQLDYHDLAAWNGIGRGYTIYPGRVLRLTPPGGVQPSGSLTAGPPPPVAPPLSGTQAPANHSVEPDIGLAGVAGGGFDPGRWEWPTRGRVVRAFAMASGSKGIDVAGDLGQIVVAASAGKVVYSGSALKGYGELVIIKHDEQFLSAYGYNQRRLVEEGQYVGAGEPIAQMGLGPEQKPLLHFEIRDRGRPIDPLPLLPRRVENDAGPIAQSASPSSPEPP